MRLLPSYGTGTCLNSYHILRASTSGLTLPSWRRYSSAFSSAASRNGDSLLSQGREEAPEELLDLFGEQAEPQAIQEDDGTYTVPSKPSEPLISALRDAGYDFAVPAHVRGKVDHSFVSPRSFLGPGGLSPVSSKQVPRRVYSLQSILADYIRFCYGANSQGSGPDGEGLKQAFGPGALDFLSSKRFGVEDVVSWAWILTTPSSEKVGLRLLALAGSTSDRSVYPVNRVPLFVPLFLLRRSEMTASALRLQMIHAWLRLNNVHHPRWNISLTLKVFPPSMAGWSRSKFVAGNYEKMDETSVMTLVIRLLRHARKVWPAALSSIAALLTKHTEGRFGEEQLNELESRRMTFSYNKMLNLIGMPSSQHPLLHVPHHQRAQLALLRKMNDFKPALVVNREGYRAVISVQLAHRKTLREREWATMKARSWPPWIEERTGLDAEKGMEMGISRAYQTILRAAEVGYDRGSWETAASILSGWDTDRSPTIQTRTTLTFGGSPRVPPIDSDGQPEFNMDPVFGHGTHHQPCLQSQIWAARIRATRTMDEAWACFLAYQDAKLPPLQEVYYATFEKLVFDQKRKVREYNESLREEDVWDNDRPMPGDGKEVDAPDPNDGIYVRTAPPTLHAFFSRTLVDGIIPSGRFLAFLLSHATTLGTGVQYLRSSSLRPRHIKALLGETTPDPKTLKEIPRHVFSAYIRLLSRFSLASDSRRRSLLFIPHTRILGYGQSPANPLLLAFRLVYIARPRYRPPWHDLIGALARTGARIKNEEHGTDDDQRNHDLSTWSSMLWTLEEMAKLDLEVDFAVFQTLCVGLEKVIFSCHGILSERLPYEDDVRWNREARRTHRARERLRDDAAHILHTGPTQLKVIFFRIAIAKLMPRQSPDDDVEASGSSSTSEVSLQPSAVLPRLLEVPGPAQLHALIRVLGLSRDHSGIVELLEWMARFAPEINAVACEMRNGATMTRKAVVAARVFLERTWEDPEVMDQGRGEEREVGDQGMPYHVKEPYEHVASEDEQTDAAESAPRHGGDTGLAERARDLVDQVDEWGGWPSDEEVEGYCRRGRFV